MKTKPGLVHVEEMFFALCKSLDTPRSLKAWLLFKYKEFEQLARFKVHPAEYMDAQTFADDYLVVNVLKKNKDLPKVADTRAEAIRQFKTVELRCKETNNRFASYVRGDFRPPPSVERVLLRAQKKCHELLSRANFQGRTCSWGNGATDDMRRSEAYIDLKLTSLPLSVTPRAARHALGAIVEDLHWSSAIAVANPQGGKLLAYTSYNVFDTVRKTVLTDRSIGKEPRLNGFLQKGAGLEIRRLLRTVGVDLTDQTHNQVLASLAILLELCTIDLESASDSLAREVVNFFCPIDVYVYLDEIRSHWTMVDGDLIKLEKFSSMGNAFTFELESTIFWALTSAVQEELGYSVMGIYGDDIICHRDSAPLLIELLSFCGFSCNKDKTFLEGAFYESCGKHYFDGIEVTPIYQKSCPKSTEDALRMANRLFRYADRRGSHNKLYRKVKPAWDSVVRNYKLESYRGPFIGEGDGHLEVPSTMLDNKHCRNRGYYIKRKLPVVRALPAIPEAMYALTLRRNDCRVNDMEPQRGSGLLSDDVESRQPISYLDRWGWLAPSFTSADPAW